jgi:hypothetical protein
MPTGKLFRAVILQLYQSSGFLLHEKSLPSIRNLPGDTCTISVTAALQGSLCRQKPSTLRGCVHGHNLDSIDF